MVARRILCLNSGSSTLKFALFQTSSAGAKPPVALREGAIEGVGSGAATLLLRDGGQSLRVAAPGGRGDHGDALAIVAARLERDTLGRPDAAGHRVVHGGTRAAPARIDAELLDELRARIPLAPLHLPQEIHVIETLATTWPGLAQVACFDTAFHRAMPERSQRLPLPRRLHDQGIRRYGYHGLSYEYVRDALGDDVAGRVVIAHLGSGSSLAALRDGAPVDTTMGFTPTGGVMMGTRSGDLDPGILLHLQQAQGWDGARLARLVNDEAGLLGVSGETSDMRRLLALRAHDPRADEAIAMYCASVRRAIGALATELGGLDRLVFTAGIGERAAPVRREICDGLEHLGITAQAAARAADAPQPGDRVRVIATNENLVVARQTRDLLDAQAAW